MYSYNSLEEEIKEVKNRIKNKYKKEIHVNYKLVADPLWRYVSFSEAEREIRINVIPIEGFAKNLDESKRCIKAFYLVEYMRLLGFEDEDIVKFVREEYMELIPYVSKVVRITSAKTIWI